jgi:pimeloyl-ACP methyl ester carboxylesterase
MPYVSVDGVRLAYERHGVGDPVLLIMGSGTQAKVWEVYQVPALISAGYSVITFDNRGVPPSDVPSGRYSLDDMVYDTVGLIEKLSIGPCRIAGVSLGAVIAQEVAAARPDLVRSAVLMATKARSDVARNAYREADKLLVESGIRLPALYIAITRALSSLSPHTIADDTVVADWIDLFVHAARQNNGAAAGQIWADEFPDRRKVLSNVQSPCLVIAFKDDLIMPPALCKEVADAIPFCQYQEFSDCGHLGFLERPDPINTAMCNFFAEA